VDVYENDLQTNSSGKGGQVDASALAGKDGPRGAAKSRFAGASHFGSSRARENAAGQYSRIGAG